MFLLFYYVNIAISFIFFFCGPVDQHFKLNNYLFKNDELRRVLADTVLTINHAYSYHMEAQMTDDEDIVFRVFEYGYYHADRRRNYHINQANNVVFPQQNTQNSCELIFPEPKIIYLSSSPKIPDEYTLYLNFGTQGYFPYKATKSLSKKPFIEKLKNIQKSDTK